MMEAEKTQRSGGVRVVEVERKLACRDGRPVFEMDPELTG